MTFSGRKFVTAKWGTWQEEQVKVSHNSFAVLAHFGLQAHQQPIFFDKPTWAVCWLCKQPCETVHSIRGKPRYVRPALGHEGMILPKETRVEASKTEAKPHSRASHSRRMFQQHGCAVDETVTKNKSEQRSCVTFRCGTDWANDNEILNAKPSPENREPQPARSAKIACADT